VPPAAAIVNALPRGAVVDPDTSESR